VLPPRPVHRGGVAVDERGEAVLGTGRDELGDELTGVGLHPPLLARDEIDEVEADVHARQRSARPRRVAARHHGSVTS
jgi:hypothetical protein